MNLSNHVSEVDGLKAGDHVCFIYETEEEHRLLTIPFFRKGLEKGEKVIYITDAHDAEVVLDYLQEDGLDVERYIESEQITLLTAEEAYFREGIFHPDGMIALLRAETRRALEQGFSALRVTGEATWALKGLPGSERLIEYETKLNEFFPKSRCLAICQYDKRRFCPELLRSVLYSHPIAVIGTDFFDNLYYIPPKDLLGSDPEQSKLDSCLQNLKRHKNTEETLRENREKLERVFECITDGVVVTDLKGDIVDLNEKALQLNGLDSKEKLIGKSTLETIALHDRQRALKRMQELSQQGITGTEEFTLVRADGSEFPAEISAGLLKDSGGTPVGFVSVIRDIRDCKRMERALRDSEKKYRDLVDNALVSVFQTNIRGEILYANESLARISKESLEEIRSRRVQERYKNPEDRERLIDQLKKHGQVEHFECEAVNAEGKVLNILLNAALDGDVISGMIMDITELKQLEASLRRSENEMRLITDNVPGLVSYVDVDGYYRFVSKQYEDWFGIARSEIVGKHYRQILGKPTYDRIRKHVDAVLAGNHVRFEDTLPYKHGGTRWVMADYVPDADDGGKVRGFVALVADVTAYKQTEKALHDRLKELACLSQVHRAMQESLCLEELCRRVIDSLTLAMEFPEIAVPVIELDGKRFTSDRYHEELSHSIYAEIKTGGEAFGQIRVYYVEDKPFLTPEEQNLLATVAEEMGAWLANRRAEEKLRESKNDLARAQQIGHLGNWNWDVENWTLTWSDEIYRIFGVERGKLELTFEGIEAMVHPDEKTKNKKKVGELLSTADSAEWEFRIIRPDGEIRHIHESAEVSRDEAGKACRIFGIMQDITERKQTEQELRYSEERYRVLFENSSEGIGISQGDRIIAANRALLNILGYEELEELKKVPLLELVAPEDRPAVKQRIDKRTKGEPVVPQHEHRILRKDGEERDVEILTSEVRIGKEKFALATFRDITDRKKALKQIQETLRATMELVELPREKSIDTFLAGKIKDFMGKGIVFISYYDEEHDAFKVKKVLGLSRSLKREVEKLLKGKITGRIFSGIDERIKKEIVKGELIRIEGGLYQVFFHKVPKVICKKLEKLVGVREIYSIGMRNQERILGNIITVFTAESADINRAMIETFVNQAAIALGRRRAEEERRDSQRRLRSLAIHIRKATEEERKRVAREIHDELGQAITALNMDLSELKKLSKQEKVSNKLEEMHQLVNSTSKTIKRISTELRPSLLDDLGLPAAIEFEVEELHKRSGISYELDLSPKDFEVDEDVSIALFRVLQEALTNVVRHARARRVVISLVKKADMIGMEIEDDGRGVTKKKLSDPGSLGIMGMRERVEALGGTIEISGILNRGTTITVSIPLGGDDRIESKSPRGR
jgi:PAS domain S-box-containing protein